MPGGPATPEAAAASVESDQLSDGDLHEVASGVHAWVQPDGSWWINNAGLITSGQGESLVIDTCATERRTRQFLAAVESASDGRHIRYAVNTHHHGDHTFGNCLLPASTVLIGHERMRSAMAADSTLDDFPSAWSPRPDLGELTLRPPEMTVRTDLRIHLGDREVHLLHPGFSAHTDGDLVVWLPSERVLFVGDLLFPGLTPLAVAGRPSGMLLAMDWIKTFEPSVVVPGHGPILDRGALADSLELHRRYFELVIASAREGLESGLTPLEVALSTNLGEFRAWSEHERLVLNLHAAYAEFLDRKVDRPKALNDAVQFLGEPMTSRA